MEALKKISEWFADAKQSYMARKSAKYNKILKIASCETINVVEFEGKVYIAYNGMPLVNTEDLQFPVAEMLESSRTVYLAWKEKFNR